MQLKPRIRITLFWAVLLFIFLLPRGEADFISLKQPNVSMPGGGFSAPNEEFPHRAISLFERAPEGAYISVGTERGFMSAALSPKVTHLVLIDSHEGTAFYNRINVDLLRIAKDRENYLHLRLEPNQREWREAALAAGFSQDESEQISSHAFGWRGTISHGADPEHFKNFHNPPGKIHGKFREANYLYDDRLFLKLQSMAKNDRIAIGVADLNRPDEIARIADALKEKKVPLSVIDLSNAWWEYVGSWSGYTQRPLLARSLRELEKIATDKTLLLVTNAPNTLIKRIQRIVDRTETPWNYRAYTFEYIRSQSSVADFIKEMEINWKKQFRTKSRLNGCIVQRLFEP